MQYYPLAHPIRLLDTRPGQSACFTSGAPLTANASHLNYVAGQIVPNAFTVGLRAAGSFNIYTPTQTHFIVDVAGYFAP